MAETVGNPPKGTVVDVFSVLNGYDKKYALPRGEDFSFNPGMTKQFFAGFNTFKDSLPPGSTFTMPPMAEAWKQWGNDPLYGGDQAKFQASFNHAAAINIAINTQKAAIEDSLALRYPVQEQAQQMGLTKKVDNWRLGEQDEFQFGQTRPGDLGEHGPSVYDTMDRTLVSRGTFEDRFGATKPLYEDDFGGFNNGTQLVTDYDVDAYGRVIGKPKLRQTSYGDAPVQERMLSAWNLQSRSDGALTTIANELGSAIATSPESINALWKQLKVNMIDLLYGPDHEEVSSRGLSATYDKILSGRLPEFWDPEFDGIGGYRDLMRELDGGGYDLVREVEASPDWFISKARAGDPRAQRAVDLQNMLAGTHDGGMNILDKMSGMYAANAMAQEYKPSTYAEANPWSMEAIAGMAGNGLGQVIPALAISALTAGTLTAPAVAGTAAKIAAKQGLKWAGARAAANAVLKGSQLSIAKSAAGTVAGRTLSTGGQKLVRRMSMGYTSAFLGGQAYKSALQAGYRPDDAATFGLAMIPLMYASEGIGSNYLINRFMSKGADDVVENMVKELGVNAPAKGAAASSGFLQAKAFKVASGILSKGKGAYKTATEKMSQSAFGNAAFGFLAEGGQEFTEELLNIWGERWFDQNVGTEAGGVGKFGPEFNMADRLMLAFVGGGVVGGPLGGILGGRRGTSLDQTIGELVSTGREKEVINAADQLLEAGSIDQDLHAMIVQEVGLVKDYNNKMDLSDPWLMDMLGSSKTGLSVEFNEYNKLSRDNQETLLNLRAKIAGPDVSASQKSELEADIAKVELRERAVQERIQEFISGKRVVQKLLEAEAIRKQLFTSPEEREQMPGTVDTAMRIHDHVKQFAEALAVDVQDQALKIQDMMGVSVGEMIQRNDKLFKDGRKLGEGLGDAVASGNKESIDAAVVEMKKYLGGLRGHGIGVSDFDKEAIAAGKATMTEALDEVYAKIDNMEEPVGSDEWRDEAKRRTTKKYNVANKENLLGTNADEVIADLEKLKYGIGQFEQLEAELTAGHKGMLTLEDLNDPTVLMDRAINEFLTTVDGERSLGDIESDLKALISSGEDMKAAAAQISKMIKPLMSVKTKGDALEMLTDVLPGLINKVDTANSSKVADQGLRMKDGTILGNDLKNYQGMLQNMSNDPVQKALVKAKEAGMIQTMSDSIGRIADLIETINSAGARRGDFLRGIQKARLEHRHQLITSFGGPELGGLSAEALASFTNEVKELVGKDSPEDLIRYERALERIEQQLHDIVSKKGLSKFFKAVNSKIIKDLYDSRVYEGYFENSGFSADVDPEKYPKALSAKPASKRDALPVATIAWSARIGYGPAKAREVFARATTDTRSGNSTPSIEQEMALIDAHVMAHVSDREHLITGLYEADKFSHVTEGRLVSIFGSAGTGKTAMNPFLIRMASLHRGGRPKTLIIVPGKNNRDKAQALASKYDLGKYADVDFQSLDVFSATNPIEGYDVVVVDESHAMNMDQVQKLYRNTTKEQVVYGLGDMHQASFTKERSGTPAIYKMSLRTLPLSVTYRQNNNAYMLFLTWARGLVVSNFNKKILSDTGYRGFNTEYSPETLEGVRSVANLEELTAHFIESFKPESLGNQVMIVASKIEADRLRGTLMKDPKFASFDPSRLVYHMEEGDGSALGAQFRSIFVHIPSTTNNYTRLLYTAASRGTDYAAVSAVANVTSNPVETVQRTEVDQNEINASRTLFVGRQSQLSEGLNAEAAKQKKTGSAGKKAKTVSTVPESEDPKLTKWTKESTPHVFDMDIENSTTNPLPLVDVSMDGNLAKGNPKLWVYGNLLAEGKMALMSGAQVDGQPFGSDPAESVYRSSLVDAISSGIFGSEPTVAMFKESVNGSTGYEYRLVLEEDGIRELKRIAKRAGFTGDERKLTFVGRIPAIRDVSMDAIWGDVLGNYINTVHERGASIPDGSEVPNSRTSIRFSRPGATILTDVPEGAQHRPTNSYSQMTSILDSDGKIFDGPYLGRNSRSEPVPFLNARHRGLPESLESMVWGRMPHVDNRFFDEAIEELSAMKPKKTDDRDSMESTLAYHYIRFNRSILVERDRADKEIGVKSIISKHFKLASKSQAKGPVFKHAKDDGGVANALDAKKALLETIKGLKKELADGNGIVKETFVPFRIIKQGGKRMIDPRDAARLEFPVQRVNFPMGIVDNVFTNTGEALPPPGPDPDEPMVGYFTMNDSTDSTPVAERTFVPAAQEAELARRIYGNRFIDGVLDFKPRERSALYGMMYGDRIDVYFDTDGNVREGVAHHEAMHWIMRNVLDSASYQRVIEEAKYRMSEEQGVRQWWLLTDAQANEWLAEEYRKNLPPTNFLSRVLAFLRNVLMRLGLYKPDIEALIQMAGNGVLTRSAETNGEPNFGDDLAMSGIMEDVDGGDAPLRDDQDEKLSTEEKVNKRSAASASEILIQHFPEGVLPVARNMFTDTLLARTEYAPVKNNLSFVKAPYRIENGSIEDLRRDMAQFRMKIANRMRNAEFILPDDSQIFFDQINKENLYQVVDSVRQGRYSKENPTGRYFNDADLSPGDILNGYVISMIGTDFSKEKGGRPDYAVFAAMVKATMGGVRYQGVESSDFLQQEKSFRQGDSSSDSLNPFGEQSALMKSILMDRPLLYPQRDKQPARHQKMTTDSIAPKMVDNKVMTQVMTGAISRIRQQEATMPGDPLNIVPSTTEQLTSMLSAELNKVFLSDKNGMYGLHAYTAMQVLTSHDPYLAPDNKTLVYSYGRAYRSLLSKQEIGEQLTPSESEWVVSLGQTLNNVISPFRSTASVNGLRHQTMMGKEKPKSLEDMADPNYRTDYYPTSISSRYFASDIEQQVRNEVNKRIKAAWTGRGGGTFRFAEMWNRFDIRGDRNTKDSAGFRIIREGDEVVVKSMGRDEVELVRSGSSRNAAFRTLPTKITQEKSPEMRRTYAQLYARFFAHAGYPISESTTHRLLYEVTSNDHGLLADAVGHWAVQVKRGIVAMAGIVKDHGGAQEKALELVALDTELEDHIATQKQTAHLRAGVHTDTFGDIISENADSDTVQDPSSEEYSASLPLPSDLFNLNVELYMADQYGRGNAFDQQVLNGNGGRSNLQAYTSTLREIMSVEFSKFKNNEASQYILKTVGDEDVAKTIPFGKSVGLKPALYFGMRNNEGSEGSNLDGMDSADVTQGFAYEFMKGFKRLRGGKDVRFIVPSSLIGDRDKNMANELDFTGGEFNNLVTVRTGQWNKTAKDWQKKGGPPIESIQFNHQLFATNFLVPQFQKFEALQKKAIDRVFLGVQFAQSLLGTTDPVSMQAFDKVMQIDDQQERAAALYKVLAPMVGGSDGRKFVAALQMPGSPIILGTDLVINRKGEVAIGSDIQFNYSSIYNAANWSKLKSMKPEAMAQWVKDTFEDGKDGSGMNSYIQRVRRQWLESGVQLPRVIQNAVNEPTKQYQGYKSEWAGIGWKMGVDEKGDPTGVWKETRIDRETKVIADAARAYAYIYMMNDAWTHDLLMGPYGNLTKPNTVKAAGSRKDLYSANMGRAGTILSSGTMAIPDEFGLSPNVNVIMYEDGEWKGSEIHDGASMSMPHHHKDLSHSLGGPASPASSTSAKTVASTRGRIVKHSQERVSPSSYAQSDFQKEMVDRAYSVHPEIQAAWAPVASYDFNDPYKVDMEHFESVFNEAVANIRNISRQPLDETGLTPGKIGDLVGDIISPRSAIKTRQQGIQYSAMYHGKELPEFVAMPLSVSFSVPANRLFVQLNAERDLDNMKAPKQTQQHAWMGVTGEGYEMIKSLDAVWGRYVDAQIERIRSSSGNLEVGKDADASQRDRVSQKVLGIVTGSVSPENYMGQVMSVLNDENVSLNNPVIASIVRSTFSKVMRHTITNPKVHGNLYVSVPGHYMVWNEAAGSADEAQTGFWRPMAQNEVLIPFSHVASMLPPEAREKARYLTLPQVREIIREDAMQYATNVFKDPAVGDLYAAQKLAEFEEVMTVYVSRTPSNLTSGSAVLRVAGFISDQGNTIAVHPELNRLTGADHDIDQWTVQQYKTVEVIDEATGMRTWAIDRAKEGSGEMTLGQMNNLTLDVISRYHLTGGPAIQERLKSVITGTQKFVEAYDILMNDESNALSRVPSWMQDIGNPAAFAPSVKAVNAGKSLVGSFMNASKSWAYIMRSMNKAVSLGMPLEQFQNEFTPGLPLFSDGKAGGELIDENFSALANQSLDDYKTLMAMGNLNITTDNVNVIIGAVASGLPLVEAIAFGKGPVLLGIQDLISYSNRHTRNKKHRYRHNVYSALKVKKKSDPEFIAINQQEVEAVERYFFIGQALNMSGVIFSHDSRSSWTKREDEVSDLNQVYDLTGKHADEILSGVPSTKLNRTRALNVERNEIVTKVREVLNIASLLREGNAPDGGDLSDVGRRFLKSMVLESDINNAVFLENTPGALSLVKQVGTLTGRKTDMSKEGQQALTDLLRDMSLVRSVEMLPTKATAKKMGRVVHLVDRKYDLANIRHQALFVRHLSEVVSQRMQAVAASSTHPGNAIYSDSMFLSQLTTTDGSGLLVIRNANLYTDPIERENMRNSFLRIDQALSDINGVQAGDPDSELSNTHSIQDMLALYSVLNDKLDFKPSSFARFVDPGKLSWVNDGFHQVASVMADPDNSSISVNDGSSMTGAEFIKSVLVPAAIRKGKLRNPYAKREELPVGGVYVTTETNVVGAPEKTPIKVPYETVRMKSAGKQSEDVLLSQSTSQAGLPFSSSGQGLEQNVQVIHPNDKDAFRQIMNGEKSIVYNIKHDMHRGYVAGPAMTPFGPVVIKSVDVTKVGVKITMDASKLSFSHGSYANVPKSYKQPLAESFSKSLLKKIDTNDGANLTEALTVLKSSGNPFIDTMAQALLSNAANADIRKITMGPMSAYDNSTGQVWVSDRDMQRAPHAVLLHEIIHGYTKSIFAHEMQGDPLTPSEKKFFMAMSSMREEFDGLRKTNAYKALNERAKRVVDHAASSTSEFVSGILAEPDIRTFVTEAGMANESIAPGTETPNIWQRFWRWVMDLLGVSNENAPFMESMVERAFYSFQDFIKDTPGGHSATGLSYREMPDESVGDIRDLANSFKSGRSLAATEDMSAKGLEDYLISNSSYFYKKDKQQFVFQGMTWKVKDPADLNKVIKSRVVPAIKAYDLRERKNRLVKVLNRGAGKDVWNSEFSRINERRESVPIYDQVAQQAFLDKLKYDRDPSAFYFLYSDLKDEGHLVTNNHSDTLRVGDSGLKYVTGIEGYDPIVKVVMKKGTAAGSIVSFFDVTSSSFRYHSSDRKHKLFQGSSGALSNTAIRNRLTSSEGHVRGYMAGLAAAASVGENVTIADIKAIQFTGYEIMSSTVSMFDVMYNLKIMKERTPFFSMLPADARTMLDREGIEEVLNQSASVHAYRSMLEESLEQDVVRGVDEKEIPVSVSIAYKTLVDRIDAFNARNSGSHSLLRESIIDRIKFIKDAPNHADGGAYSLSDELETLQDMLIEIDKFDNKFALGRRYSESFMGKFKTSHNLSDPAMQWVHAKIVDGQHEVSARTKLFSDMHAKKMREFEKNIGWSSPDQLIGGGWKKYDVLFMRSSTSDTDSGVKIYDKDEKLVSAYTGEVHWDRHDPRTAKLLKENKLSEAHLEYSNWLMDQVRDMMVIQLVHAKRTDTTSEFWHGITFSEEAAKTWAEGRVKTQYPRGWMPILSKRLNEAISGGDFKGSTQAALRRMENASRIVDDEIPTSGELESGSMNNTFLGELFPFLGDRSQPEYVGIGKDNRTLRIGLTQRLDGDYLLTDSHVNTQASHDPEHIMNNFMLSGWRKIVHEQKTLPAYEAYLSWEGRQADMSATNSSTMKLFTDGLIHGKQSGSELKIGGMNMTPALNGLYSFNSLTRLALNVPVWFGNILMNTTSAYRTAIANSAVNSDLFGVKELTQAMKITSWDLASKEQRAKIQALMNEYKVFEMSELDATRNYRRMVNDKALWSSHIMHIGNWGFDFQMRAAAMVAQMLKDGSWDAHGVDSEGNMTYDIKKDERFYKDGKRVHNSEVIEQAIKERLMSDYMVDQKSDEPLKRGYDTRMAKIFSYVNNKYIMGGMDSLSQTAADNLWYMQFLFQFRRFIPDKLSNALQSRMTTDLAGSWEVTTKNGEDVAQWVPREVIGYASATVELFNNLRTVSLMPNKAFNALDQAAKESLARLVADGFVALGVYLAFQMLTGGFGDKDEKDKEWWQKSNAFNRRFLYAAQDIYAYTPGLLHDNILGNAVPAADMVVGWWDLIAGKDFEKAVKKTLWNVPGYGSWKSFSDLYTAEEEASKTSLEKKADRQRRAEERELEALEEAN